jgi:hypothetical protein
MRLGPVAIFLTIIVMVLATLAFLTISTSNADMTTANRFASVTAARYRLEADGDRFLSLASEAGKSGNDISKIPGAGSEDDGYIFKKELNGYRLVIRISTPDRNGDFEVRSYKMNRMWNPSDPASDIWTGN